MRTRGRSHCIFDREAQPAFFLKNHKSYFPARPAVCCVCLQVPQLYKRLKYPFQISKSNLTAVGSPHTWPSLLVRWAKGHRAGGGRAWIAGGRESHCAVALGSMEAQCAFPPASTATADAGLRQRMHGRRAMQTADQSKCLLTLVCAVRAAAGGADVAGGAAELCGACGAGAAGALRCPPAAG